MVNTSEFTKRIESILDFYDLSATSFADKIGVGRSSISHILSGRNKPSLDFVMKVVQTFEDVELYWLLNGKGKFPSRQEIPKENSENRKEEESFTAKKISNDGSLPVSNKNKEIKRIVFFYTDGTFEAFES